ncbi:ABC transporter substrate-binding protein [Bauldia sp.]|uniref:ABC transporter substrate-binding protein n=1 Tax=Bauldia sp. TaxID=2575872 RepID=UPI003BA92412
MALTRRNFMAASAAAGAAAAWPFGAARAATDIVWNTWNNLGLEEYLAPFVSKTGISITQTYMSTNDEQFAKFRAGGLGSVDVFVPGQWEMSRYIAADMVRPLDMAKIPNAESMYPAFAAVPYYLKDNQRYGVPFYWGINSIVYRKDLMDIEPDWSVFFEGEKYAGKLAMRDYAIEAIIIAALYVGIPKDEIFSMSDAQFAEVKKALLAQKKLLRTYWTSIADLTNLFATGEVVCAFSWLPPYYELNAQGLDMGLALPKSGVLAWCDALAIPPGVEGEKLDAVYEFVNYLLGPEYGKMLAIGGPYAQSTSLARDELTPEQQERVFIKNLDVMDSFIWKRIPNRYNDWVTMWNEVKAS